MAKIISEAKMKKLLLAACLAVAFAAPCHAFGNDEGAKPKVGGNLLTCHPPLDRKDSDPVTSTDVELNLASNYLPNTITVRHHLFSGGVIDRSTQYSNQGVWKEDGQNVWSWGGYLFENQRVSMIGRVYLTADGNWFYEEHIFHDGHPDKAIFEHCEPWEGE
jgi:hypothetical protein